MTADQQYLTTLFNQIENLLEHLMACDTENEEIGRVSDELIGFLNPQSVVVQKLFQGKPVNGLLKSSKGIQNLLPFKIIGTNRDLQSFEAECIEKGLQVSKANSYFRDDYEHCLIPCYAYDGNQPKNIKLQTMSADAYDVDFVYNLPTQHEEAMAMVEVINSAIQ